MSLKAPKGQFVRHVLLVKYNEPLQEEQEVEFKHVKQID
jgi:hypothetical protein